MLVDDGRVRGGVVGKDFEVHGPNGASRRVGKGGRGRQKRMEYPEIGEQLTLFPLTVVTVHNGLLQLLLMYSSARQEVDTFRRIPCSKFSFSIDCCFAWV